MTRESSTDLDHDVSLEVVLKSLQLELEHRGEVIKQHPLPGILWHTDAGQLKHN